MKKKCDQRVLAQSASVTNCEVNEELLIECRKLDECTSRKLTEELLGPSLA